MKIIWNRKMLLVLAAATGLFLLIGLRAFDHIAENKARAARLDAGGAVVVETLRADMRPLQGTAVFSAGLEPIWIAEISAKVDGRITQVAVSEGERVAGGELAVLLENSDTEAEIMQARGNLFAAQSNLEQAALDYGRYSALEKDGAVAAQTLDAARTKRDAAQGQMKAAQGALALAEEKAANLRIAVPRAGVVTKRHLQEGVFVRSGTPLITVADTDTLLAKATVGEAQIASLAVGTMVEVQVDAMQGETFTGMITMLSPVAALPARTFNADIAIDNTDGRLRAGMFATVKIPLQERRDVLAVPENAIVRREDQPGLFVVNEESGTVVQRIVRTGIAEDGWIEVVEGLQEGEMFVAGGQAKLRDGMKVKTVKRGESP